MFASPFSGVTPRLSRGRCLSQNHGTREGGEVGASVSPRPEPGSPQGRAARGAAGLGHMHTCSAHEGATGSLLGGDRHSIAWGRCFPAFGETAMAGPWGGPELSRITFGPGTTLLQSYWPIKFILISCLQQEIPPKENPSPQLQDMPPCHSDRQSVSW